MSAPAVHAAAPSSRRAIGLVVRREVRSRLFSRAFVVGLVTTVALIFGVFGMVSLFGGDDPLRIGVTGDQPRGAVESLSAAAELTNDEVEVITFDTRAEAEAAVDDGDVDGAVVDGQELLMSQVDDEVVALVLPVWQQSQLLEELGAAGLSDAEVASAFSQAAPLTMVELDPTEGDGGSDGVAVVTVILLFLSIQIAGAYIMMGVFEEKSSKVVELVLSSVKARHLLFGKIVGVGVLGLTQVVALGGSALLATVIFSSGDFPSITVGNILLSIAWFILGYLLYGSVFAAGASLAPRQEDAQSTMGPISVVLMLSYFGAIIAASDPTSTAARVMSIVPITAPFAMPGRIASGGAPWWEIVLAMGLTAGVAAIVLLLAERIYVRSIIHTDRKLGWREAWKLES